MMARHDDIPLHRKFGYAHTMERQAIRAELLADGHADDHTLHFAVVREQERRAKGKPTLRQRQDAHKAARALVWGLLGCPTRPRSLWLSGEELDYLRERLAGVNDPVGQSILEKLNGQG